MPRIVERAFGSCFFFTRCCRGRRVGLVALRRDGLGRVVQRVVQCVLQRLGEAEAVRRRGEARDSVVLARDEGIAEHGTGGSA